MPETITLTKPLKGFIDILRITQGLRADQYPEIVLVGAAKDSMVDQIADALLYANGGDRQKFRERIGRSSRVRLTPVETADGASVAGLKIGVAAGFWWSYE